MSRTRASGQFRLDHYTQFWELAANLRRFLNRSRYYALALLIVGSVSLLASGQPGAAAFALICLGMVIPIATWIPKGIGLPILPLIAIQDLIVYGLPIADRHTVINQYTGDQLFAAGLEVFVHGVSLALSWRLGMMIFAPSRPICYALPEVNRNGLRGLSRLGFSLIGIATAYWLARSTGLLDTALDILPNGASPIIGAINGACSACGFFLVAMAMGSNSVSQTKRLIYWSLLAFNCLIAASQLLLSAPAMVLFAVAIGLFWGGGRLPWRFLVFTLLVLAYLNVGKFAMREHYWSLGEQPQHTTFTLTQVPAEYEQWATESYDLLADGEEKGRPRWDDASKPKTEQTLTDRLDNLQNLLFAIDATGREHIAPIWGASYTVIPALLIPRILWPDKPRSHEGQIMLNVHFGRQDLASTYSTYIAWGLLAEAYGNFGPFVGSILLGIVLGVSFAWLENVTARKLVVSLEGFASFAVLIGLANSYEMVASVLVTSIFQALVPIVCACMPFVRRQRVERPAEASPV